MPYFILWLGLRPFCNVYCVLKIAYVNTTKTLGPFTLYSGPILKIISGLLTLG